MYTRLTGIGLERLGVVLHPVDQLHLGLRGQHDLAVHACRQTTGVALRHPPHAHQRVRARAEHQLLQPADPWKVPRLRRREDPLPQPPYVRLRTPPVNLAPSSASSSGPLTTTAEAVAASSLSFGSGVIVIFLFTGSPDRVSTLSRPGTRPGIRPVIRDGQLEGLAIASRFPAAFRPPAFASRSSHSRRGIGPSSRSAYRAHTARTRRGYRVPHARAATGVGAPYTPRTTVLIPD